ncbi:hypothetical protein LINPERHAP1_LOCUS21089 [Linum perenne]
MLEDRTYYVKYESLENICFSCGFHGHKLDACTSPNLPTHENNTEVKNTNIPETQEAEKATGEWMIVTRKTKGRPRKEFKALNQSATSGSRFNILQQEKSKTSGEPTSTKSNPKVLTQLLLTCWLAVTIPKKGGQSKGISAGVNGDSVKVPRLRKPLADLTNGSDPQPATKPSRSALTRKDGVEGELLSVPVTYNNPIF